MKKRTILLTTGTMLALALAVTGCGKEEIEGSVYSESNSVSVSSTSSGEEVTVTSSLKEEGYFKEILEGSSQDPTVKTKTVYDTNWSDSTWEGVEFKIDKVKIVEVDKFEADNESYKELISIHYTLANDGDIDYKVTPDVATLTLEDGTTVEAKHFADYWDNAFTKEHKKDGYIYFVLKDANAVDEVSKIDFNFNVKSGKDDTETIHTSELALTKE